MLSPEAEDGPDLPSRPKAGRSQAASWFCEGNLLRAGLSEHLLSRQSCGNLGELLIKLRRLCEPGFCLK